MHRRNKTSCGIRSPYFAFIAWTQLSVVLFGFEGKKFRELYGEASDALRLYPPATTRP